VAKKQTMTNIPGYEKGERRIPLLLWRNIVHRSTLESTLAISFRVKDIEI
jgi:hypothetical protein